MAKIGDFMAQDLVAEITNRCRYEVVQMIQRVAAREKDETVAARLREIADALKAAKL